MAKLIHIEILEALVNLLYPKNCSACENSLVSGEEIICTHCLLELPKTDYHFHRENEFFKKLEGRLPVKFVVAQFKFVKESKVQRLLHNLKYNNRPEIGTKLGRVYGNELVNAGYKNEFDLIIPVPLHVSRARKRGYNQSAEFGKGLSDVMDVPFLENAVQRITRTATQTKKSRLNRWENVSEVFKVLAPEKISGKRILLVDDVITTGATLEACANSLLQLKGTEISIACIAAAQ